MGEGRTNRPSLDLDRLTVAQAADALSISQDAVRKRIARGTISHDRDESGRVYVYLAPSETVHKTDQDTGQDAATKTVQDTYIRSLEDQIAFLRGELERKDAILLSLTERIPELEAPQGGTEAYEADEEQGRGEPRSATGGAQEGAQRSSMWLPPVERLPWWHYGLGLLVVYAVIAGLLAFLMFSGAGYTYTYWGTVIGYAGIWVAPGVFGLWVGLRRRNLRLWSQIIPAGALVGVAAGFVFVIVLLTLIELSPDIIHGTIEWDIRTWLPAITVPSIPSCILYVSGALIGNAWQRRRIGRSSGITPASPVSRTTQGAVQQPRKDLTPAQQAILGWGGAIISALITLVGTIIQVRSGR